MTKNKINNLARIVLYLVPIVPLIFFNGFFFPFIISKIAYFRILMHVGLAIYLILLYLDYREYKPKLNKAFYLFSVLALAYLVAGIFGFDFYKSFWSYYERMDGIIGLLYLLIYLFLLNVFFKKQGHWHKFIQVFLGTSMLVSLYGIVQKFAILPVYEAGLDRVASTVGNAAFLAGYLVLAIGFGFYYYKKEDNIVYKRLALFSIALNLFTLFLTATRGAILGLLLGFLLYLFINSIYSKNRNRRYSVVILVIVLISVLSFYFARDSFKSSNIEALRRVATISLRDSNVLNRLTVWNMAWQEAKTRPILGVGPENFDVVYNKNFTPDINEDWFDRTHNIYLDHLVSAGFVGFFVYLAILIYIFYLLWKSRKQNYFKFSILSSVLLAHAVHNIFVFDTLSTSVFFVFLLGYASFKGDEEGVELENSDNDDLKFSTKNKLVLSLVVLLNIFFLYWLVYLPVKINRSIYTGYRFILADTRKSFKSFEYVFNKDSFGVSEAAQRMNNVYGVLVENNASQNDQARYEKLLKTGLKQATQRSSYDLRNRLYLGQLIINSGRNVEERQESEEYLVRAVQLSPNRPEAVYLLFNSYLSTKQTDKAIKVMEEFSQRVPWFGDPKIFLANAVKSLNPEQARIFFEEGLNLGVSDDKGVVLSIIEYLLYLENYQDVLPYYERLVTIEPSNYGYRLDLAKVYYLLEDLDKSIEQINIISNNSPELLDTAQDFVQLLEEAYIQTNQ